MDPLAQSEIDLINTSLAQFDSREGSAKDALDSIAFDCRYNADLSNVTDIIVKAIYAVRQL